MSKTRTFVAVELDPTIAQRAAAVITRLKPYMPNARWVESENLHLTLLYLGELSDQELAEACSQTDWVARANHPFTVRVAGMGAFPSLSKPKTLWLGATEGGEEMTRIHSDLDEAVGHLISKGDNLPYLPHLTLARLARGPSGLSPRFAEVIASLADYDAGSMPVTHLTVFASELHRDGPEYHMLARSPLGMSRSSGIEEE